MSLRVGLACDANDASRWRALCVDRLRAVAGVELALRVEPCHRENEAALVARVREARLDVLVHLDDAPLPAALSGATRYGVWRIHHGDGERYSPGPVARWEPHCAGTMLHAALIATAGDGSPPLALQEGRLRRLPVAWPRALEDALRGAAEWPAKLCRAALELGEHPLASARPVTFLPAPDSSAATVLGRGGHRAGAECRRWLRNQIDRWREDQWAVGVVRAPIHALHDPAAAREVAWIPERSRREYIADPFAYPRPSGDGIVILGERFDHATRRGHLCAIDCADGRRFGAPRTVLALPGHLAYPFLFESDGRRYCIPELAQSGGTQLFEVRPDAEPWRFVTTLVEGLEAVDPTLVRYGDRLWLFCTTREDPAASLHVWWARDLAGPWRPHARNPVKVDVRSTRPAGTPFVHGGALYRPSQDCSRTYGAAVCINRVHRLTPDDYAEETVAVLRPDPDGPYPAGLHTISALGEWTLIDGKRRRWRLPWGRRGLAPPDLARLMPALDRLREGGVAAAPAMPLRVQAQG